MKEEVTPPHGNATLPANAGLGPGTRLVVPAAAGGAVVVEERLATRGLRRFFKGLDGAGTAYTVVEDVTAAPNVWQHIPDHRVLRPLFEQTMPNGAVWRVLARPAAISVTQWLEDREHPPAALDVLTFGVNLCQVISAIHGMGRCVLSLDPEHVLRTPDMDALLANLEDLPCPGELPRVTVGSNAAPEVLHRVGPLCGITSDVYVVGALVHALLAQHPLWNPPPTVSSVAVHQFSPRVWRQELPLGIWPRLAGALHPDPARRLPHLAALQDALQHARAAVERRYRNNPGGPVLLDAWADSHVGVGKARRGGDQQDRLFCGLGAGSHSALAAVADGVSHATLGDGGTAAEHTAVAVRALFEALPTLATPVADAALGTPVVVRHQALKDVLDSATTAICKDANHRGFPPDGETSGVMASTLVAAWVEGGVASVLNVGDSRCYVWDGATMEAVNLDHDRKTESVRAGLDPYTAAGLEAAGALTRAVGRVVVDAGALVASPSPPDFFDVPLLPGDRLLLCSDGLPDYVMPPGASVLSPVVVEETLCKLLKDAPDPPEAAHALVGVANRNGGHDNIAVVLIFVGRRVA